MVKNRIHKYQLSVDRDYFPEVTVSKLGVTGTYEAVWKIPFHDSDSGVDFCEMIGESRFAVLNWDGLLKIYDIATKAEVFRYDFHSWLDSFAIFNPHTNELIVQHSDDDDYKFYLSVVDLTDYSVSVMHQLPYKIETNYLHLLECGDVLTYIHYCQSGENEDDADVWFHGVCRTDFRKKESTYFLTNCPQGDRHRCVLPVVSEVTGRILMPTWDLPKKRTSSTGEAVFGVYAQLHDLRTLRLVCEFKLSDITQGQPLIFERCQQLFSMSSESRQSEDFSDTLEDVMDCIVEFFPSNDDYHFWVLFKDNTIRKFNYFGETVTPLIEPVVVDDTWKGQINRLGRGKIISIDDEFLVLQTVDGEYKVVVHYKDIQIPLSREEVATCRAEVSLTSSSLPEVPEHVQKEFEAHRITIIDVDESSRNEVHLLAALDRAIERTRDISPLIVDDRLPFYFSLPGGYLRNEEQFFYYVIEFPKAGAKINQLVLNVLAFAGFERLKFQNNAPVFLEAAKLLGEYFPQYIDTVLEYMRRAFQHHQAAVSGELIPALYNAYRFRPEFERIKTVCQKVGFREADVPYIRLSGEKVSLLTHSGLWNRVVSVGGYEQPYFIFIELVEGQFPEDIKADEIENGSLDLFEVNATSLLIVGELSSVAEVNNFLKGFDGNLPERSQITVYAHNPLSDPIETLSKLEVVRRKAETDLCSSSWFVFNDLTTQRPIWPGFDGYNVYPREYIESLQVL